MLVDITYLWDVCLAVGLIHFRIGAVAGRSHQTVLGIADAVLYGGRLIHLLVQSHLLDDGADKALTVGSVIHGEIVREAQAVAFCMQDAEEDAMERTHPEVFCPTFTHQSANALLHFAGSLVREGQCQDVPGIQALFQQVGYLVSQHPGLARACSCNHQRRSIAIEHSFLLSFIQFVQVILHIY